MAGGGGYYETSRKTPGQDWGDFEGPYDQWAVKLVGKQFQPISKLELPDEIQEPNMLILMGTIQEHVAFEGTSVTLKQKEAWRNLHPLGVNQVRIEKPKFPSSRTKDVTNLGLKK